jgi:hypothetical protein
MQLFGCLYTRYFVILWCAQPSVNSSSKTFRSEDPSTQNPDLSCAIRIENRASMSFFDDSPELAADLRDVFNILYPPSPTSTTQEDWEETEEESTKQHESEDVAMAVVDLDGPVNDLPPLDVHETHAQPVDHESTSKAPGYVESLMNKLSRVRSCFALYRSPGINNIEDLRNVYAQYWIRLFR